MAKAGNAVLYADQLHNLIPQDALGADSAVIVQNYINRWAKRELMYQKAVDNLSPGLKAEIEEQLNETRSNLVIYQYQRQMMFERMDTAVADAELESYFAENQQRFILNSNIVKALFIKLPSETPNMSRIRRLARSNAQEDLLELETLCYQFADKFDDFNERWISFNRLMLELNEDIQNEESFLRRTHFFESSDSVNIYMVAIRDYRLRLTVAPFDYVRDDIKRIIWNNRRIEFIHALENSIYNDALKENNFTIL